jgi:Plant transposon protein
MNPFIRPCSWDRDSSSSGEDERRKRRRKIVTYTAASALAEVNTSLDARTRGGSRPGKSPNRDRAICQGAIELDKDYFNRLGLVSAPRLEFDFERRYRMPGALLYERVRAGVLEVDSYFEQRPDAAGVMGASADQKITAAMRQLAYGYPTDAAAELVRVSESLASESLIRFCRAVREKFEPDYLRRPNKDELREIEQHYASLGFPCCIGCVDVSSWTWDKCPVAWQVQYTGKENKPCNRL